MTISQINKEKITAGMDYWYVQQDFHDPLINYLVYGFGPGRFFEAVLANDLAGAVGRAHPNLHLDDLRNLAKYILTVWPEICRGSYSAVHNWINLPGDARQQILEKYGLIFSEREEIMIALSGKWFGKNPHLVV